jgi:hypothetical protein
MLWLAVLVGLGPRVPRQPFTQAPAAPLSPTRWLAGRQTVQAAKLSFSAPVLSSHLAGWAGAACPGKLPLHHRGQPRRCGPPHGGAALRQCHAAAARPAGLVQHGGLRATQLWVQRDGCLNGESCIVVGRVLVLLSGQDPPPPPTPSIHQNTIITTQSTPHHLAFMAVQTGHPSEGRCCKVANPFFLSSCCNSWLHMPTTPFPPPPSRCTFVIN